MGSDDDDNWMEGLLIDGDRLCNHLEKISPVFLSIQQTGDYLLRVRNLIHQLELSGATAVENIPDDVADKINENMSNFTRAPASRFYEFNIHPILFTCLTKRRPKECNDLPLSDSQYHAAVSYCLVCQHSFAAAANEGVRRKRMDKTIAAMSECVKARPDDAAMHVTFGNFLLVNGFSEGMNQHLEKALQIDEQLCFASHYTLANEIWNKVPMPKEVLKMGVTKHMQAIALLETSETHLLKYLKLAPTGHWHVHRACMMLICTYLESCSSTAGEQVDSVERRYPGFCAFNHDLFERGVQALELYNNSYGRETKDFKRMFKNSAKLITTIHRFNLLPGKSIPDCKFFCSNLNCKKDDFDILGGSDDNDSKKRSEKPLKLCSKCRSVRYCSRYCQVEHFKLKKNGHKNECKRLATERDEKRKLYKMKLMKNTIQQIGHDLK